MFGLDTGFLQYSNQSENVYSKLIIYILLIIRVVEDISYRVISNIIYRPIVK